MRWEYINITKAEDMLMSGWKLYIYGNTVEDGRFAASLLEPIIKDFDMTVKIATNGIIRRNLNSNRAWSSMVIYLDPHAAKRIDSYLHVFRFYLRTGGYSQSGNITGAKCLDDGLIHLRYDMEIPIDPLIGCDYETYKANYRGEYGDYNIPNNKSLF